MTQAVRHDAMRARNLALVLGEVSARRSLTRAALAEITGLTKTTVSKLVADLIEAGLVVEAGAVRDGERGRPGVEVRISGSQVAAVGLEINVDYLSVQVVDLARTVRLRRTQAVDNRSAQPVDVIARLRDLTMQAVDEAVDSGLRVVGGVLAVPGPVDLASGTVHNAPNLGWRDVPLSSLLRLPFPVRVENEANLAALGELWFGSGLPDFLHVSGEIGIGAGLVVRGRLFRGAHGFAGELGHVVVAPDGPLCRCGGRGCLEQYAGQDALLNAARPDGAHPDSAHPDASQLHAARLGTGHPNGARHDTARPDASQPDASQPDTAQPEAARPDTARTDAFQPAGADPDTARSAQAARESAGRGIPWVLSRLEAGDERALAACERAGWALGVALCSAVNLVDPDAIVLGGIYAPLFPWIGDVVATTLTARLGQMRDTVPPVVVSRLGTEAAALGAAGQVIEQVIADPAALLHT
ncbi:ROK family transcriptional regulator [Microbispora sp. ATCC PTA-5024]|uniref:ROK family transcriptional regulator n=1 Tax=Microbispora sp. ATCC PTA-5024 TaxID=316330 RepID=UPI0003DC839D|nr:ROK family transcriptional regulator [Microbispora sp. ATCC PTA-5024]ETK34654.1 ROK family transcriptional regulator [Microbispora sp. ATCC PTA-5024]